jgi:hypothetical protein
MAIASPLDSIPAPSRYPRTSRYFDVATAVHRTSDGREIPYATRRLLAQPGTFTTLSRYQVREGDRLDVLANRQFGDAEQWWRLADPNPTLDPRDLTATPGRWLRITLPAGVPGAPAAG